MHLQIIIPTLNRPEEIKSNINHCLSSISKSNFIGPVELLISENSSDLGKEVEEAWVAETAEKAKQLNISFKFIRRGTRLSLGQHVNSLMRECNSTWQLWIGDDDCFTQHYWDHLRKIIQTNNERINACFAGYQTVKRHFFLNFCQNKEPTDHNIFELSIIDPFDKITPSFIHFTLRGNQLSGLLFRTSIVQKCIPTINPENLYPWMTLMGESLKTGKVVYLPSKEIYVTSDIPKLFAYGKDGLQGEITEAIASIPSLNQSQIFKSQVLAMKNRTCHWRMRMTSNTITGMILNTFSLFKDSRIPSLALLIALPQYFRYFVKLSLTKAHRL